MAYATPDDLHLRFGSNELLSLAPNENGDGLNTALISAAIADAEAEIDSYINQRYRVPLASVPDVLVGVACDLARYRLYSTNPTEEVAKRYEQRIAFLRDVSAGRAGILVETTEPGSAFTAGFTGGGCRLFSRDTLKGY